MESTALEATTLPALDALDSTANNQSTEAEDSAGWKADTGACSYQDGQKTFLAKPSNKTTYILLLGRDSRHFTEYVETVMIAQTYLKHLGYHVIGAFMSLRALANPDLADSTASTTAYVEMSKESGNLKSKNDTHGTTKDCGS